MYVFFISFVGLLLKHLLVGLHLIPSVVLPLLEDGQCHVVKMVPGLVIVHAQVSSHSLDYGQEGLHATINVGSVGVGSGTKNMRHLRFLIFLNKVPNLLVRAKWRNELALLVLNLTLLKWIYLIFFIFGLCSGGF